ncbi:MAG: Crp/Fnr family transcriptional regulator [Deferribacteraceae bacterium]|jgi:CRP-like cAMP-binding protein|nr:Crp/Fnr family transcriptional regulator [Deferribacteraceae bacterium]
MHNTIELSELFDRLDIVQTSSPPELREVYTKFGKRKIYNKGEHIVTFGIKCSHCYYVNTGSCVYIYSSFDGTNRAISLMTPDSSFGETPSILKEPAKLNVICLERTDVFELPFSYFEEYADRKLLFSLMRYIAHKNTNLYEIFALFNTLNTAQRLLFFFRLYARKQSKPVDDWYTFKHRFTHEFMAEMVGATRVTVTLFLNKLKANGLLVSHGRLLKFRSDIIAYDYILKGH